MSVDTITNFIESVETVMAWVQDTLQNDGYWDIVHRIDAYSWEDVYHVVAYERPPTCIVVYKGGKYQNQPRAVREFSVFVAERDWRDKEAAELSMSQVVDKVIGLLDHELANDASGTATTALIRVKADNYVSMKWSGVTAREIVFEVEDY